MIFRPHRGIAFVEFDTHEGAQKAVAMNGQMIMGRPVRILLSESRAVPTAPHSSDDHGAPKAFKTRMCQHFLESTCRHGDLCTFAHHISGNRLLSLALLSFLLLQNSLPDQENARLLFFEAAQRGEQASHRVAGPAAVEVLMAGFNGRYDYSQLIFDFIWIFTVSVLKTRFSV